MTLYPDRVVVHMVDGTERIFPGFRDCTEVEASGALSILDGGGGRTVIAAGCWVSFTLGN